jgi:hypothetical protein
VDQQYKSRQAAGTLTAATKFLLKWKCVGRTRVPAKSKAQQKAAGAALAAKRGKMPKSKLRGASKEMAKSMSEKELDKMASTKRKGKPERVSKTKGR